MKKIILIFGVIFICLSCNNKQKNVSDNVINEETNTDTIGTDIFELAYTLESTAPFYIVFNAINLNTGETKEICCEAPFLSGALHTEYNKGYTDEDIRFIDSLVLNSKERLFKFSKNEALKNIGFDEYPNSTIIEKELLKYDIENYKEIFTKTDSIKSINFDNNEEFELLAFAHIMFKAGILVRGNCIAGNYLTIGNHQIKSFYLDFEIENE